jgi:hypothetical protein
VAGGCKSKVKDAIIATGMPIIIVFPVRPWVRTSRILSVVLAYFSYRADIAGTDKMHVPCPVTLCPGEHHVIEDG